MSNESQQGTAKGIDGAVKYCMSCGVEFDPPPSKVRLVSSAIIARLNFQ